MWIHSTVVSARCRSIAQCQRNSIQLKSILSKPINTQSQFQGDFDVKEIYRALAFTAAHLHLISRDYFPPSTTTGTGGDEAPAAHQNRRCQQTESSFYLQNLRM